jgi:hypothetical protein
MPSSMMASRMRRRMGIMWRGVAGSERRAPVLSQL